MNSTFKSILTISFALILIFTPFILSLQEIGWDNPGDSNNELVGLDDDIDPAHRDPTDSIISRSGTRADGLYEEASEGLPAASPSGGDSGWTGIDFGDFNGDGYDDLVAVGRKGNGPEPFKSDGNGKWTYSRSGITASWNGRSDVRLVDINNDNKLDIITSDSGVWLGDGAGSWIEASKPPITAEDVAVGDFNNDNKMDIALIGHLTGGIRAYYGDNKGNWIGTNASNGLPSSGGGHKINFADVNNDNNLDIIASYSYDESVWLGDGKGNWTPSISGMAQNNQFWGVATGDIDHDNNIDIAMTVFHSNSNSWGIHVYKGDGAGKWSNASTGLPTTNEYGDIELVDMNNDGNLDVVAGVCGFGSVIGSVNIWYGDGSGTWTKADVGLPQNTDEIEGLDVGDINNDGYLDIGISYYGEDGVQVWKCITPTPVNVNVTSPNGGEQIRVASQYNIKWHAVGGLGVLKVDLHYSTSGPTGPYQLIADTIDNTGEYLWDVPLIESTNCFIKVRVNDSSPFNTMGSDISNGSFELFKLPINSVVISPDSLVLRPGDIQTIEARAMDTNSQQIEKGVEFTWSHEGFLGTIDPETGSNKTLFTAQNLGDGKIRVSAVYFGVTIIEMIEIKVVPILTDLAFTPPSLLMIAGNSYSAGVKALDNLGVIIEYPELKYMWNTNDNLVKFDSDVTNETLSLTALKEGTGELEVTVDFYNMTATKKLGIEVFPWIYQFGVLPEEPEIKIGDTLELSARALSITGTDLTSFCSIEWYIDDGSGSIDYTSPGKTALFTPDKPGWVKVNATLQYLDETLVNITWIFVPQQLNKIKVVPESSFAYFDTPVIFTVTPYDINGFEIKGPLKLKVEDIGFLGQVHVAKDGRSFEFTGFNKGTGELKVKATYYDRHAEDRVEIIVPPALELLYIETSAQPLFARQSLVINAFADDVDGDPITSGLTFNWTFPENFTNIQIQDNQAVAIPVHAGKHSLILSANYFGFVFSQTFEIEIIPTIDKVEIEFVESIIGVNEKLDLVAHVYDTSGNKFLANDIDLAWETTGGTLDRHSGSKVSFKSSTKGTFTVKVTATLVNYRTMTGSNSMNIQVQPQESSAGWLAGNLSSIAAIAVIAVLIILITVFLLFKRKRIQKKAGEGMAYDGKISLDTMGSEASPVVMPPMLKGPEYQQSEQDKYVNFDSPPVQDMNYQQIGYGYDQFQTPGTGLEHTVQIGYPSETFDNQIPQISDSLQGHAQPQDNFANEDFQKLLPTTQPQGEGVKKSTQYGEDKTADSE
jgi:hypothetical protein